jgi:hypothetical protein
VSFEKSGKRLREEFTHFVRGIDRNLATPELIETINRHTE